MSTNTKRALSALVCERESVRREREREREKGEYAREKEKKRERKG